MIRNSLPTIDCAAELTALHAAIADLETQMHAIPPQLFTLRHRVKALEAYALTLPQTCAEAVQHLDKKGLPHVAVA